MPWQDEYDQWDKKLEFNRYVCMDIDTGHKCVSFCYEGKKCDDTAGRRCGVVISFYSLILKHSIEE